MQARRAGSILLGSTFVLLALFAVGHADDRGDKAEIGAYKQFVDTIKIPGDLAGGFDISWADPEAGRYYLADRGTASIDVIDTKHNTFLYAIKLNAAGNGVVAIRKSNDDEDELDGPGELWVGDASSVVEVIDLKTKAVVATIPTNGNHRADELAYDPLDHIVMIANDQDTPVPFVTFISTKSRTVLGTLDYPQAVFGGVGHGIEQPVWNGKTKRFYISLPATAANPAGEVDEINPRTETVTRVYPTTCSPAGLALVPGQRLVTSCGDVVDIKTGAIVHVAGAGGDEIWFNPGDERVYFGGGLDRISVPVLDTDTDALVATLTAGVLLPPPALSHMTHSVAADSENNRIFVPVSHEGVKVFTDSEDQEDHDGRHEKHEGGHH
jgi:hypothetical protein